MTYWNICRRVYLAWALIVAVGFIVTYFHQLPEINNLWLILSLVGLGYMGFCLQKIGWGDRQLFYTGLIWLLTISFGLTISFVAFIWEPLAELTAYMGSFWLIIMGVGLLFNEIVDRSQVYFIFGSIEILSGLACYFLQPLAAMQYLVAGIVGGLAMVGLIIYR